MNSFDWSRRGFTKAAWPSRRAPRPATERLGRPAFALEGAPRLKLVDKAGKSIKASALETHANYIFLYPYVSTPCLLLRLGAATSAQYRAKGRKRGDLYLARGRREGRSGRRLFSDLPACSFPTTTSGTSFLTYNKAHSHLAGRAQAITCCAHASVFDPAEGAKVVAGPATFPLAAVQFDYDAATDELTAVGLIGTSLFDEFFGAYRADLNAEFGRGGYRELIEGQTTLLPMRSTARISFIADRS